jgi:YcxB-like protein
VEAPTINISFSLDIRTRYRASRTLGHFLWSTWIAYGFFVGIPTIILIIALKKGFDLSRPAAFNLPGWANLLAGYMFMFVFMPLLQLFQIWSASRHNKTLLGIQNITLTPEGFSTSSDAFNVNFKWDAIHKAIETKHFFFLYISARNAYFIPKEKFLTAEDLEKLRIVLKTYLKEKARLRSTG